jgi:hypothetical protein
MWAPATAVGIVIAWAVWRTVTSGSIAGQGWVLLILVGAIAMLAAWASYAYHERFQVPVAVRAVGVVAWLLSLLIYRSFGFDGDVADLYVWGPVMYVALVRTVKFLQPTETGLPDSDRTYATILAVLAGTAAFAGPSVLSLAPLTLFLAVGAINLVGALLPNVSEATPTVNAGSDDDRIGTGSHPDPGREAT